MRIVIDLDGTICPIKQPEECYENLVPYPEAVTRIKELRNAGHYIIIQTARNMATCESNQGRVLRNVGRLTLNWLAKHDIEYDEIYFGKPNADIYIDDRSIRFKDWNALTDELLEENARPR